MHMDIAAGYQRQFKGLREFKSLLIGRHVLTIGKYFNAEPEPFTKMLGKPLACRMSTILVRVDGSVILIAPSIGQPDHKTLA